MMHNDESSDSFEPRGSDRTTQINASISHPNGASSDHHTARTESADHGEGVVERYVEASPPPAEPVTAFWAGSAIAVSYFSLVSVLVLGIVGLLISQNDNSVSMLGYAFDQFLDVVTSLFILWRFGWCSFEEIKLSEAEERRDNKAAVCISILFVLLSQVIGFESITHLVEGTPPENSRGMIIIAVVSIILFFVLAGLKYKISQKTHSTSLRKDAYVTLLSSVLSFGILLQAIISRSNPSLWWLDGAIAIVLCYWLLYMGLRDLWKHDWWKKDFWITPPPKVEQELEEI